MAKGTDSMNKITVTVKNNDLYGKLRKKASFNGIVKSGIVWDFANNVTYKIK